MTVFDLTINHLYAILRDAVKYSPTNSGGTCQQLQTFRVLQLDRGEELGVDGMGAKYSDRNTVFFFSRSWDRQKQNPNKITADFPVLTAFELSSELPKSAFENQSKQVHSIEVSVIDQYKEDCTSKSLGCDSRTINQIYSDTETLLFKALQYLAGAVIAYTPENETPAIYNVSQLEYLKNEGSISSYEVIKEIGAQLAGENKGMSVQKVEMPTQKLYGTRVRFTFPIIRCNISEYAASYKTIQPISHESGCVDCG
jgi:hypothetical protein